MRPIQEAVNKPAVSRLDTKDVILQQNIGLGEPWRSQCKMHVSYDPVARNIEHVDHHSSLKFG